MKKGKKKKNKKSDLENATVEFVDTIIDSIQILQVSIGPGAREEDGYRRGKKFEYNKYVLDSDEINYDISSSLNGK